jgi:microcystin-dependent protein
MASPYLSEIRLFSFFFPPKGWAFCNGALLPINQNQALFSLLGTSFGGDGRVNFALPNLQGRVALHMGHGFILGQQGGEASHTLGLSELPLHTHILNANTGLPSSPNPSGNLLAASASNPYSTASPNANIGTGLNPVGGSQAHENMSPYLVLSFCIALQGIYPSRN